MVTRRLIRLSLVFLLVSLSCQFIQPMMPFPAAEGGALLNEVLFLPAQGGSAFIELKSPGQRVSLNGLYLMNEQGDSFALPDGVKALASDQFLLILFDGTNLVEDQTIHASQTGFLNPESGFVELYASDRTLLDRVAWGSDQPGSVKLSRGGRIPDLTAGTTIGRFPASTKVDPTEWVTFSVEQATPGAANPNPGVEFLLPLNGAIFRQSSVSLSWYPVAGAAQYRVQMAVGETFTNPVMDQTVDTPQFQPPALAPGVYYWRVQAIAANGSTADFSPANRLTLENASTSKLSAPARANPLAVPWIQQHKDTRMLMLESNRESGDHAWDVDHKVLDQSDPADIGNCAPASIAMVARFWGGNLSQDRINFEVFKGTLPGPEMDLNYNRGLEDTETTQAITFALGAAPTYRTAPQTVDVLWADVKKEIDAERPIIASNPGHVFVITGYSEVGGRKLVTVNDPWSGTYQVDIASPQTSELGEPWDAYWLMPESHSPVSDEPEIGMNSDGDGIVDFDETQRFGTNPNDADSDKDNLEDKDDIRGSVFDPHFGYAIIGDMLGRDFDDDGLPMEKDEDSDGGGCFDGMEDDDLDGKFKKPETWNFDEKDDACFWGTHEIYLEDIWYTDDGSHHQQIRTYIKFSLEAVERGKLEGLAQVKYTHTGEFGYPDCSGTHDIGTQFYKADLEGEFEKLQDGGTLVTFKSTPDHGPEYIVDWNTNCPGEDEVHEGWSWGGMGGTLRDGVYDLYNDMSSVLTGGGEFWQKVHMEQGQGMQ